MKYSVEKKEEYAILTLEEDNLNSVKAPELKSEFYMLKNAGVANLILSLEKVKYVDSSGLSAILTGNRIWAEDEQGFILTGIDHPSVRTLITISRLDSVLTIAPNLAEAEKMMMLQAFSDEVNSDEPTEDDTNEED